jgi:hypothetical protein
MTSSVQPVEIGSLRAISPDESQFLGSSSGIFFVNTVYRAFAKTRNDTLSRSDNSAEAQGQLSIDDCIVESESPGSSRHSGDIGSAPGYPGGQNRSLRSYGIHQPGLGLPPSISLAKELLTVYFRVWHPLFPFLHGPSFLQEIEIIF